MKGYRCLVLPLAVLSVGLFVQQAQAARTNKEVADSLINRVKGVSGRGYTQSEAHMSLPMVQEKLRKAWGLAKGESIITAALDKEKEMEQKFPGEYYVFYTAVPHMRLFHDIFRKIYEIKFGKRGALRNVVR